MGQDKEMEESQGQVIDRGSASECNSRAETYGQHLTLGTYHKMKSMARPLCVALGPASSISLSYGRFDRRLVSQRQLESWPYVSSEART